MPRKPVQKPSSQKRRAFSLRPTPRTETKRSEKPDVSVETQPKKSALRFQTVRGMRDILPDEYTYWTHIYRALDKSVRELGFRRIELPMLEDANLYRRSVGEMTDIVEKELYEFTTRGGDRVALRPEMTAGLVRAFLENGMQVWPKPIKLFTSGSLFRYDRPQAGRYREHRQANFDVFGEVDPILDAQMIQIASRVLRALGLKRVRFLVNSLGMEEDRKEYRALLLSYLRSKRKHLCEHCLLRMKKNPLRVLDCKEVSCREVAKSAPHITEHLSKESHTHFKRVLEYLDEMDVSYEIDPFLVRGLDYYNDTVFEVMCDGEKDEPSLSLGGGGRYDDLIRDLGGEDTPAVGFGLGLDRIVLEMQRQKTKIYQEPKPRVFLAQLGEMAKKKSLQLFEKLEKNGILLAESFGRGALKSQLRQASRSGAELTIILGQKEAIDETVIVKDMRTGSQETVPQDKLVEFLKRALKNNEK
jgi:histidyl-tRNA synthetase